MDAKAYIIDLLNQAADRHGVDRRQVHAIAHIESRHRQWLPDGSVIRSRSGALGVMQLMPATAVGLGVNPSILEENIEGGVRYFRQRLDLAAGDVNTAVAMYYAGIGNVRRENALHWPRVQRYLQSFHYLLDTPAIRQKADFFPPVTPELPVAPVTPDLPTTPIVPAGHRWVIYAIIVLAAIFYLMGR